MEYSLWNMHGPTLWPSSSSVSRTLYTTVHGETIEEIQGDLPIVTSEEIQASDLQVGIGSEIITGDIHSDLTTDVQEVVASSIHLHDGVSTTLGVQEEITSGIQVCGGQPGFVAMKPEPDSDEQVSLLVSHQSLGLDPTLASEPTSIVLKVETTPQKRIKIQRPRRAIAISARDLNDPDDIHLSGTILPPVDNLWNNSIVGANVSVKTESDISYMDDTNKVLTTVGAPSLYEPMVGRLPVKQLEPLSDESEEEEDDESMNQGEDILQSSYQQNLPRMSLNTAGKIGYECGECAFMADTRPGLKRHITVMHPAPAPDANLAHALMRKISQSAASSVCPVASCRYRASDRDELEAHVSRHVAEGTTTVTPKKKSVPSNLQRVRYEREEYRCQMCSYACTIEKAFYKHLKVHSTGTQPLPPAGSKLSCVICGKDRPSEADMNKHMRKHRDDRYFCCDICVFRTVQLKKLIQHRRMHTGEKPHLCPHCPYRSARRDNLRSHVRRVHKKENLFCDTFSPRGLVPGTSATSPTSSQD